MEIEIGAKRKAEEMAAPTTETVEGNNNGGGDSGSDVEAHPYAFHVSGPRNLSSPNWRDLINSSWLVKFLISNPTLISLFFFYLFCSRFAVF